MNDTPRTEAQVSVLDAPLTGYASYPDNKEVVPAEYARELERQLAAANANLATVERDARQMGLANVGLLRDAARLDWLESECHTLTFTGTEPTVTRGEDGRDFTGETFREAIDAAMKGDAP